MTEMLAGLLEPIITNRWVILGKDLCILFIAILWLATVFWTYRDAARRGALPWFWALVGVLFPFVGWTIYMVVRPPEVIDDARERDLEIRAREAEIQRHGQMCPACDAPIDPDFLICPSCMMTLRKECVSCGKALQLDWSVCPYCRTKQ